jgi:hypothetical protein
VEGIGERTYRTPCTTSSKEDNALELVNRFKINRKDKYYNGKFQIAPGQCPGAIAPIGFLRGAKSPELPGDKN